MSFETDYLQNGFCTVKDSLPEPLLMKLRKMAEELETDALTGTFEKVTFPQVSFDKADSTDHVWRMIDVFKSHYDVINELLASPKIIDAILTLVGHDAIPLCVDLQFKTSAVDKAIVWHQDSIYERNHPYCSMGIYLDDSNADDGCLRMVKGSHNEKQDIFQLASQYGWNIPQSEQVPVTAGDTLIHDMMTLHGSPIKRSKGYRRTIYIEFRPWQAILESGDQTEKWVERRKKWMLLVLQKAGKLTPHQQEVLRNSDWTENPAQLFAEIYANKEAPTPSNWAFPLVEREDYPVEKAAQ